MKILDKDTNEGFIWCQCPECKGIAPYKQLGVRDEGFFKEVSTKEKGRRSIVKKNLGRSGENNT